MRSFCPLKSARLAPTGTRLTASLSTVRKPATGRRKSRAAPRTRLAAVIERCDRAFGPIELPEADTVLEKAVYLVLREKGTPNTTARAMTALRDEFVDWNEVRVSRAAELSRLMSGSAKAT